MSVGNSAARSATGREERGKSPALFARRHSDRVLSGVASGIGARWGIDPVIVRLAFVALAMAGGTGVVIYVAAWVLSEEADEGAGHTKVATSSMQQTVAVGLVVLGALLVLRSAGLWFGDALVWPVAMAAFGSSLIWTRDDARVRDGWSRVAGRVPGLDLASWTQTPSLPRLIGGGLLIAAGMASFLAANDALPRARNVILAVIVTFAGGALIVGPGVLGLVQQLSSERRERIRSQERAEMAAHLHDSVLQTLALMQRTESANEVSRLARRQERELRAWLYGRSEAPAQDRLRSAVEEMAAEVESLHDVSVEVVVVGDHSMSDETRALTAALREATSNAARHSGMSDVAVYVEIEPVEINAFVRDQGKGFDPQAVDGDRRGIRESIVGRMRRIGGAAVIDSRIGQGTEIHLQLPLPP